MAGDWWARPVGEFAPAVGRIIVCVAPFAGAIAGQLNFLWRRGGFWRLISH